MAKVGTKAQGQDHNGKLCVRRHGSKMSKGTAHRCEKAFETKVRQAAKKEIREQDA